LFWFEGYEAVTSDEKDANGNYRADVTGQNAHAWVCHDKYLFGASFCFGFSFFFVTFCEIEVCCFSIFFWQKSYSLQA